MKKLLLIIFCITLFGVASGQKPVIFFGHIPDSLFTSELTADRTIKTTGDFFWSLDAIIGGVELNYNKETSNIDGTLITAFGGAVGYKHYKPNSNGAVSDFGINLALMTKVKINETTQAKLKIALLGSFYNLMAGPIYTPSEINGKRLGLLIGANINF